MQCTAQVALAENTKVVFLSQSCKEEICVSRLFQEVYVYTPH